MTLLKMKKKVLRLIEEINNQNTLTDDPDIKEKLNDVINQVMFELARIKKIPARDEKAVNAGDEIDLSLTENFYQLYSARLYDTDGKEQEIEIFEKFIDIPCDGTLKIKYYKYPVAITDTTIDEEYEFELTDDVLEVMPYGVAADLLKSDISNNYGKIYAERYETMKQQLDPRHSLGTIYIEEAYNGQW